MTESEGSKQVPAQAADGFPGPQTPGQWEANLAGIIERLSEGILVVDADGDVVFANRAAESMLPSPSLVGQPIEIPTSGGAAELRIVTTLWNGEPASLVVLHQISRRYDLNREMAHRATHDSLTGLPNRYLVDDRLRQARSRQMRTPFAMAAFYCDLDNLKVINDRYGHLTGDAALIETARRLQRVIRPLDTTARIGGDEFVIVCEDLNETQARAMVERLNATFREPLVHDDVEIEIGLSVGFAVSSDPQTDPSSLLDRADRAMNEVKQRRRNAGSEPPSRIDE